MIKKWKKHPVTLLPTNETAQVEHAQLSYEK